MPTMINISGLYNLTTTSDLLLFSNQVSNNLMGGFLSLALFVIILFGLLRNGFEFSKCTLAASFASLVVCIPLLVMGLISVYWASIYIIFMALSTLFIIMSPKG